MSRPVIRRRALLSAPLPDLHPVVARVLAARGISDPQELDAALKNLLPPAITGLDTAVERLARACDRGERILVVGDFDADGATSTALAVRALRMFGHHAVDYLVPNRFDYGYGLSPELVAAAQARSPDLILTVDNGVSSHRGVAAAHDRGIDVVITDHHLPPPELPPAAAVVNPNRGDCTFASKNLAGVGVIFYVLAALRTRLQSADPTCRPLPSLAGLLDLVALGTVADVVPLDYNNRILVEQGLRRLRAGQGTAGVAALLRSGKRDPERATAMDLAYAAAPRLNAAGRIADMGIGIEALLTPDSREAAERVARLDALNRDRRAIEHEMKAQADAEVARLRSRLAPDERLPAALVLHDARWHQGVSGILAGRMRQAVHRPTAILADAEDGSVKGSCRSIPGLHMRDILAAIDARRPGLLVRFGGHAMAAGMTVAQGRVEAFRTAFVDEVERALEGHVPALEFVTDGPLTADELTLATAEALRAAAPWGAGFPPPSFNGRFRVRSRNVVGEHHLKLQVQPDTANANALEAIAFHADLQLRIEPGDWVEFVYRLEVNEFRGRRSPQLVIEHLEPESVTAEALPAG